MGFGVTPTNNQSNDKKEMVYMDYNQIVQVDNVRVLSDTAISFSLKCRGFAFYNMMLRELQDGSRALFSASVKAKNGQYYNQYAVYLSDEDKAKIINTVIQIAKGRGTNGQIGF